MGSQNAFQMPTPGGARLSPIPARRGASVASVVPAARLAESLSAADELIAASRSESTRQAYRSDWQQFTAWCEGHGLDPLSARDEHVAAYVAHLVAQGRKPSTVARAVASLAAAYRLAGHPAPPTSSPVVKLALAGMRRTLGVAPDRARPLSVAEMQQIARAMPDTLAGVRDRALLLVGFAAALRRSELASLVVGDLAVVREGLLVTVRRSKTDQNGEGAVVPVAYAADASCCPVRSWQDWLRRAALVDGPAWRSITRHGNLGDGLTDRAINDVLLRAARRAGVSTDGLSAHSLRAGYVTSAALAGAPERAIANVSRHKSVPVLRSYVRQATIWQDAATNLGW